MRLFMRGTSPILVTAALSIAGLVIAAGVHFGTRSAGERVVINTTSLEAVELRNYLAVDDLDGNGVPDWRDELFASSAVSTSSAPKEADPLENMGDTVVEALYGGYLSLKQYGSYTQRQGDELAQSVAANIRAPLMEKPLTVDDVVIRENSIAATLQYRTELREALAPMVSDEPPEIEYYAHYVSTKDPLWLAKLADAATRYRAARDGMLAVAAPQDAIPEHLRALNALGAYAETLERLSRFAHDTFAAVALLKTMNETEEEMLAAFDALAQYYVRTIAQN